MADDNMKERLSALMDGELEGQELAPAIRELQDDSEQRRAWQSYHLIGDALRKNLPTHLDSSFASRVSQAIAAEIEPSSSVVEFKPKTVPAAQPRVALSKPLAGFALAASVAAIAYLGVGMIAEEEVAAPRIAQTAPVMTVAAPTVMPLDGVQTVQGQHWSVATPAMQSKLNSYLNNHHSASGVASINSYLTPNVILVEEQTVQGE